MLTLYYLLNIKLFESQVKVKLLNSCTFETVGWVAQW